MSKYDRYTNIATKIDVTNAIEDVTIPVRLSLSHPDRPMQATSANNPNAIDNELVRVPNCSESISEPIWRAFATAIDDAAQMMKQQAAKDEQITIHLAILFAGTLARMAARKVAEKPPRKAESNVNCSVIPINCSTLKTFSILLIYARFMTLR